jgi:hypothetical protein
MQLKRTLTTLAIGGALIAWGLAFIGSEPEAKQPRTSKPAPSPSNSEASTQGSVTTPVSAPKTSGSAASGSGMEITSPLALAQQGLHSADPYPIVLALREQRVVGSQAAAGYLLGQCFRASLIINRPTLKLQEAVNEPNYAARLAAKDQLSARCSRFSGEGVADLSFPIAGDTAGLAHQRAHSKFTTYGSSTADRKEAFVTLIEHGNWAPAKGPLLEIAQWRQENWKDRREDYALAYMIAEHLALAQPNARLPDIRLLMNCLESGECLQRPEQWADKLPPERRTAVLALANSMAVAMRARDLRPFLGE